VKFEVTAKNFELSEGLLQKFDKTLNKLKHSLRSFAHFDEPETNGVEFFMAIEFPVNLAFLVVKVVANSLFYLHLSHPLQRD